MAAQEATNVDGTARMLAAAAAAGVGAVVVASSVGAYSPGPKDRAVDESWPTEGIPSSAYSRQKARVERLLDAFEADQPDVRIVRIRPGLVFQGSAGSEIARYLEPPGRRILTAIRGLVVGPGRDADPRGLRIGHTVARRGCRLALAGQRHQPGHGPEVFGRIGQAGVEPDSGKSGRRHQVGDQVVGRRLGPAVAQAQRLPGGRH